MEVERGPPQRGVHLAHVPELPGPRAAQENADGFALVGLADLLENALPVGPPRPLLAGPSNL